MSVSEDDQDVKTGAGFFRGAVPLLRGSEDAEWLKLTAEGCALIDAAKTTPAWVVPALFALLGELKSKAPVKATAKPVAGSRGPAVQASGPAVGDLKAKCALYLWLAAAVCPRGSSSPKTAATAKAAEVAELLLKSLMGEEPTIPKTRFGGGIQVQFADRLAALLLHSNIDTVTTLDACLSVMSTTGCYATKRGVAQVVGLLAAERKEAPAGLLDRLTLMFHGRDPTIKNQKKAPTSPKNKISVLLALACIANRRGARIASEVDLLLPLLEEVVESKDVGIKTAAREAASNFMTVLTLELAEHVLATCTQNMSSNRWNIKARNATLLSFMSHCDKKVLAVVLPTIVALLIDCLGHPRKEVQAIATQGLTTVGSKVGNPEILSVMPDLILALTNPAKYSTSTVTLLLKISFINPIDATSLAILMPIVLKGLRDQAILQRQMTMKIVGSISALIQSVEDILPYAQDLLLSTKNLLLDFDPEVRMEAATALGNLYSWLGEVHCAGLLEWLQKMLLLEESTETQRLGASLGFVHCLAVRGLEFSLKLLPDMVAGAQNKVSNVRLAFFNVFVIMPSVFSDRWFLQFIPQVMAAVIGAQDDDFQVVADLALSAGQEVVKKFAPIDMKGLYALLFEGLHSDNWRVRLACIQMFATFLLKLCDAHNLAIVQLPGGEAVNQPTAKQEVALEKAMGARRRVEAFCWLYIMRADTQKDVADLAWRVWHLLTENNANLMAVTLPSIMKATVGLLADESKQCVKRGVASLNSLIMTEGLTKLVPELSLYLQGPAHIRKGVCLGFREILASALKQDITAQLTLIVTPIRDMLCDEELIVRTGALTAFEQLFSNVGRKSLDRVAWPIAQRCKDHPEAGAGLQLLLQKLSELDPCVVGPVGSFCLTEWAESDAKGPTALRPFVVEVLVRMLTQRPEAGAQAAKAIQIFFEGQPECAAPFASAVVPDLLNATSTTHGGLKRHSSQAIMYVFGFQKSAEEGQANAAKFAADCKEAKVGAALTHFVASETAGVECTSMLSAFKVNINEGWTEEREFAAEITGEGAAFVADSASPEIMGMSGGAIPSIGDPKLEALDQAEVLVNCDPLTLGFFGKILLLRTSMLLYKGHRYGIVGQNGVGKSSLLRRIADRELPNFPTDVNTIYVDHAIEGDNTVDPIKFMMTQKKGTDAKLAAQTLTDVGFPADLQTIRIDELSGGWRMRLALARAVLLGAELMILDEPTNHLDVDAVKWLTTWLNGLKHITVLIVSHEPEFLDAVCTDIFHYHSKRLDSYRGNFSSYLEQAANKGVDTEEGDLIKKLKFRFPDPGQLPGLKGKERAFCHLKNVDFKYPSGEQNILTDVTCQLRLSSRVGVIGVNGAGKSTLIKLLAGEHDPSNDGECWRHHNLRVAYISQHSFHHLAEYMDKSPASYIRLRFRQGADKESAVNKMKEDQNAASAEQSQSKEAKFYEGRTIEALMGRIQRGKTLAYQVKWVGYSTAKCSWVRLQVLRELGGKKMAEELDEKLRISESGMDQRPLHDAEVCAHLADFGLDRKYAKGACSQLSGGQRSRVVLAAAMWTRPHLLILDEPTNFLDQEAMFALSRAIRSFGGAVLVVSHHREFLASCCPELWHVEEGRLRMENMRASTKALADRKRQEQERAEKKQARDVAKAEAAAAKAEEESKNGAAPKKKGKKKKGKVDKKAEARAKKAAAAARRKEEANRVYIPSME